MSDEQAEAGESGGVDESADASAQPTAAEQGSGPDPSVADSETADPEVAALKPQAQAALRMLRSVPLLGALPTWAAVLAVLGLASLALILVVLVLKTGLLVIYQGLGGLLSVLLVSLVLAYLLDPLIDRFERGGWSRSVAIGVSLGLFVAAGSVATLLTIPYVVTEVSDLGDNMDGYLKATGENLVVLERWLSEQTGVAVDLRLAGLSERLPGLLQRLNLDGLDPIRVLAGKLVGSTFGLLGTVLQWSLLPLFTFFFLRDFDAIKRGLFELVPCRWRRDTVDHYLEIDERMGRFVRGQLMVSAILAVIYSLGLGLFTDIDLAVLVGVLAGLLFVVPYFGTFLGIIAGSVLAFLKFGVDAEILKVWAVFAVGQGIEGALLTPKIVGDSVGLHPVVVVLALVAGGNLFGFLGILLAVPIAAAVQVLLATVLGWYRDSQWFREGEGDAPLADEIL